MISELGRHQPSIHRACVQPDATARALPSTHAAWEERVRLSQKAKKAASRGNASTTGCDQAFPLSEEDEQAIAALAAGVAADGAAPASADAAAAIVVDPKTAYDSHEGDPQYSRATASGLWEISVLTSHYHPSVTKFAGMIARGETVLYPGNPLLDFARGAFLDRFVTRKPKRQEKGEKGPNKAANQLMFAHRPDTSSGIERLIDRSVKTRNYENMRTIRAMTNPYGDDFKALKEDKVRADDLFLHKFHAHKEEKKQQAREKERERRAEYKAVTAEKMRRLGLEPAKRKKRKSRGAGDEEDDEDAIADKIIAGEMRAIASSRGKSSSMGDGDDDEGEMAALREAMGYDEDDMDVSSDSDGDVSSAEEEGGEEESKGTDRVVAGVKGAFDDDSDGEGEDSDGSDEDDSLAATLAGLEDDDDEEEGEEEDGEDEGGFGGNAFESAEAFADILEEGGKFDKHGERHQHSLAHGERYTRQNRGKQQRGQDKKRGGGGHGGSGGRGRNVKRQRRS